MSTERIELTQAVLGLKPYVLVEFDMDNDGDLVAQIQAGGGPRSNDDIRAGLILALENMPAGTSATVRYSPDDVEAYLKRRRDVYERPGGAWSALDDLLDDYRDHVYTGTPLGQDVQGPTAPGEQR